MQYSRLGKGDQEFKLAFQQQMSKEQDLGMDR